MIKQYALPLLTAYSLFISILLVNFYVMKIRTFLVLYYLMTNNFINGTSLI